MIKSKKIDRLLVLRFGGHGFHSRSMPIGNGVKTMSGCTWFASMTLQMLVKTRVKVKNKNGKKSN
jgi:hypothetical protein